MNSAQATVILAQINSIESQLVTLKHQVEEIASQNGEPPHTFADLKGLWAGHRFSEEEIEASLYKLTPEWMDELATLPQRSSE